MQIAAPHSRPPATLPVATDPAEAALTQFDAWAAELFALAVEVSGDADAAEDALLDAFAGAMRAPAPLSRAAMAMRVHAAALAHAAPAARLAAGVDDADRCAVQLALYARLTVTEIAAALCLTPGEVKRRLAAGLRSMRSH